MKTKELQQKNNQNNNRKTNQKKPKQLQQDASWPFPPPGGPTGPCKRTYTKKADKASVEEFGEALW